MNLRTIFLALLIVMPSTVAVHAKACTLQPGPCMVLHCTFTNECVDAQECTASSYEAQLQSRSDFRELKGSEGSSVNGQVFLGEWVDHEVLLSGMLAKDETGTISLRPDFVHSVDGFTRTEVRIVSISPSGGARHTVHTREPVSSITHIGSCVEIN